MPLLWKRPVSSEYPKIWHTFSLRGEKYVIQDLPQSMTEEAIQFMKKYYYVYEPLASAYGLHENAFYLDHCELIYRLIILKQKASLVCFKEGSNEICGLNMNYITTHEDYYSIKDFWRDVYMMFHQLYRLCTGRKYTFRSLFYSCRTIERYHDVIELVKRGVTFEADTMLTGGGLCVSPKYRGRGIGVELLRTRKQFCEEFDIQLTVNAFTSDISDKCADKAGFKLESKLSYDSIRKAFPHLKLPLDIDSETISYRSMRLDEDV